MRAKWIVFLMALALLPVPLRADDEPESRDDTVAKKKSGDGKKDDKSADEKKADDAKSDDKGKKNKPSPIKKLIEVRLDAFLIPARAINIPLPGRQTELRDLTDRLEKWSKDEDVGGLLLNLDGLSLALPDIEELRAGVAEFRKSGKKVLAFLNAGDPIDYLLACQADEIAVAPTGGLTIPGLGRLFPYMRGYYQMQGIEFDVITAGKFKYPGFNTKREPPAEFVTEFTEILDSWFSDYVDIIAKGRKLDADKVRKMIDIAMFTAEEAKNRGLVDVIAYYDDYRERLTKRNKFVAVDSDKSDFANITSIQDLLNAVNKQIREANESYKAVGPKIAVLHARGPIVDQSLGGAFASQIIMRDEFCKSIDEIRKNKTIKAVVLRIDSPGGSGYASDIIWRHLRELDEEKPLVVSMGSVAGSGGYYIACPARLIFAESTTITGSIGVIAMLANQASMINRLDVKLAEMKRGARALFGSGHRDIQPDDREFLQKYILDFYEVFLDRVAVGRKMPKDEVRKLAQGRIYTGKQALKIGLIDRVGGLNDALAAAREMANIPTSAEFRVVHYPRPSSIGELVSNLFGAGAGVRMTAQGPAANSARVSYQTQVRWLAGGRVQPLCWMALPELSDVLGGTQQELTPWEVLGLPAGTLPLAQP